MQLLKPDPMVVVTKLMERKTFEDTGKLLNVLAKAWIHFMICDGIDHMEDTQQHKEVYSIYLRLNFPATNKTRKSIHFLMFS